MSTELEGELRAAFKDAGEPVMPPENLANRVRRAVRRKLTMGACAALAVVAAAVYLTSSLITGPGHSALSRGGRPKVGHIIVRLAPAQNIDALAASGRYLYIATDNSGQPPFGIAAYDRATGRQITQIGNLPGKPNTLMIGSGNSVWLSFYPDPNDPVVNQVRGPCGTWLLTANLDQFSGTTKTCSYSLLPTGRDTALVEVTNGLDTLAMPPPGRSGQAALRPYARFGRLNVVSLARAGGHVAAVVTNDQGDYHLVVAGLPGVRFGGGSGPLVLSATAEANGLWAVTAPNYDGAGPLVRLSDTLRPITPTSISANPILQQSENVWSAGHTVWVAANSVAHELVCFTYRSAPGRIATVPVRGQVAALAAVGHTVYVTIAGGEVSHVYAYTVPPACR